MSDAQKFDGSKPPMELLSTTALTKIAEVMAFGAQKYSANQWRIGMDWSRLLGATMRHLTAYNDGENLDSESGLSHLAHAACCIMFLLEFEETHPEFDDRYKVYTSTVKGPVECSTYKGRSVQALRLLGEPDETLGDTYNRLYPDEVPASTEIRHPFRPPLLGKSCYICGHIEEADCHVR